MASMAKITIIGNLGRDAELKYLGSGTPVAEFSVATNEQWKDRSGNPQEHTQWFRISLWGKQAESLKPYLLKGKQVYVDGRLRVREYNDRDGNKRFSCDVRADTIQLLGGRGGGQEGGESRPGALQNDDNNYSDDEIPF
ncbi:MAG TPA: single-stranded DNA-binding protein [Acidobacteria bacterium]|nr:single-stranded DNA-binding protein [Acidobacteriota bacterium]